jgi:hypothetical protein
MLSTTYYVSPTGRDINPGTSTAAPFQTLAAVDKLTLAPGDQVLLAGGATFTGTLSLTAEDAGASGNPVTISSYGTGRATIAAGDGDGIDVFDTSGVAISNLNVEGDSPDNDSSQGINLFNDRTTGGRLADGVSIDQVDVGGFGLFGIGIGAITTTYGFDHVSITNATLHDDDEAGLESYAGDYTANPAPYGLAHADVYVAHVTAHDNPGNAIHLASGNGIELGDLQNSTIERSVAYDNGTSRDGAPAGIWAYNCDNVTIQYNESYGNQGKTTDGDGFDLDGGTTHSTLQYNYSHDNYGAGYLLCQFADATAWSGNTVRYNISVNDGRANSYGAINLYTPTSALPLTDTQVYGNTIYVSTAANSTPSAVRVLAATDSVDFYNNVFDVAPGLQTVNLFNATFTDSVDGDGLTLAGNDYWTGSATDAGIFWAGTTYDTLAAWRTATGEEQLTGTDVGLDVDPTLVSPGVAPITATADDLATPLAGYELAAGSPLIDAGVSLTTLGLSPGATDFFGSAVPQGAGFDIGANEAVPGSTPTTPTATTTSTSVTVSPAAAVAVGTAVDLTATVTSMTAGVAPTGTVTFTLADGTVAGTATLGTGGVAVLTTTTLPAGIDVVTASYAGDTANAPSASPPVTVAVNPPGLAPTVTRSTVPATVVAGTPKVGGKVTLLVTNATPTTESGTAKFELFASATGALDGSALSVASVSKRLTVRAGRQATVTVNVTAVPTSLTAGTYSWVARVTDSAGVASIGLAGSPFTVAAAAVTLSATAKSTLAASVVAGKKPKGSVVLTVTNAGNTATTAPLTTTLYLSTDGTVANGVVIGHASSKAAVKPNGKTAKVTVALSAVPTSTAAGSYTVLAVVTDAAGHSAVVTLSSPFTVSAG